MSAPRPPRFHGHVDPASGEGGGPVTGCRFEYIATFDAAANPEIETFKGAKSVPCSPAVPPDYTTPTDVSASVTGLTPGTEYRVRLVVGNSEGENSAVGENFATVGRYNLSTRFGSTGSGDGQLEEPLDVAIDEATGAAYVADAGNHRVDQFSAAGSFIRAFGADVGGPGVDVCTSGCQAGTAGSEPEPGELANPKFIEVDNSAGPSAGDVYVADGENRIVQKFDSSGNLLSDWGSGGAVEFTKSEGTIGGITVDEGGNLFVLTDNAPYNWTEFSQDGLSVTKFPTNDTWAGGAETGPGDAGRVRNRHRPGRKLVRDAAERSRRKRRRPLLQHDGSHIHILPHLSGHPPGARQFGSGNRPLGQQPVRRPERSYRRVPGRELQPRRNRPNPRAGRMQALGHLRRRGPGGRSGLGRSLLQSPGLRSRQRR